MAARCSIPEDLAAPASQLQPLAQVCRSLIPDTCHTFYFYLRSSIPSRSRDSKSVTLYQITVPASARCRSQSHCGHGHGSGPPLSVSRTAGTHFPLGIPKPQPHFARPISETRITVNMPEHNQNHDHDPEISRKSSFCTSCTCFPSSHPMNAPPGTAANFGRAPPPFTSSAPMQHGRHCTNPRNCSRNLTTVRLSCPVVRPVPNRVLRSEIEAAFCWNLSPFACSGSLELHAA